MDYYNHYQAPNQVHHSAQFEDVITPSSSNTPLINNSLNSNIPPPRSHNQGGLSNPYSHGNGGFRNNLGLRNNIAHEQDRVPLLFVDVNIEDGKTERIIVYDGDKSDQLASRFASEHGLDPSMKQRLKELLDMQINSLLTKIQQEPGPEAEDDQNEEEDN